VIKPVDLGICHGYEYEGNGPVAIALPGRMLAGMPSVGFAIQPLTARGWRVVQVWDELLDNAQDPDEWSRARAEAAAAYAGEVSLVIGKSMTTRCAGVAADRGWAGVWLTPLLDDEVSVTRLQRRTAPALLVGGTEDPTWDGALAHEISPDVVEIAGADHGLARVEDAARIVEAVGAFSDGLRA
jgi:pimeloyl-ACP methyl ester carboxylesterase